MNSACCAFAVCSITQGAILADAVWVDEPGGSVARDELIAAKAVMTAAIKRNEQKIRRDRGVVNIRFSFVIIRIRSAPDRQSKPVGQDLAIFFPVSCNSTMGCPGLKL